MLSCAAGRRCHGGTTSSSKPGKLFCRDAGLSAHLKQKAAEFPPGEFRLVSDVYCRDVGLDLPVHLDVVVTSSVHNRTGEWEIAGEGVAVAREERRKFREWGADEISGCTARLVPMAFESQGRWERSAIGELERLARLKGGLDGRVTDRGSEYRCSQSRPLASLAQRRTPARECGDGARSIGAASAGADRRGPAPG